MSYIHWSVCVYGISLLCVYHSMCVCVCVCVCEGREREEREREREERERGRERENKRHDLRISICS